MPWAGKHRRNGILLQSRRKSETNRQRQRNGAIWARLDIEAVRRWRNGTAIRIKHGTGETDLRDEKAMPGTVHGNMTTACAEGGNQTGANGESRAAETGSTVRRKTAVTLGIAVVAVLAAASAGLEATVAQAVETQAESTDGDGARSGDRNHNKGKSGGDDGDGGRSSNRNHSGKHAPGDGGEPTASDGR